MTNASPTPAQQKIEFCRSCRAHIIWGVDAVSRKPMPIDAEPSPNGNISMYVSHGGDVRLMVLAKSKASAMRAAGQPLYLSHFGSCPHAADWRKDRR